MTTRKIKSVSSAVPTMEGAGVSLHRAFGFGKTEMYDPFLLLDDFRSDNPDEYIKGFPWHPHRGIETITYVLKGNVSHGDSIGNSGSIGSGEVQWMTAGSGIIHQEMPEGDSTGRMYGFQLWANLSSKEKMCRPRYQQYGTDDIPVKTSPSGSQVRVICGTYQNTSGPVEGIGVEPEYLDINIPADTAEVFPAPSGRTVFAYIVEGSGTADNQEILKNRNLVLFDDGDQIKIHAGSRGIRLLLISGTPLKEPVAWHGPIVMNSQEELKTAFQELEEGTFLKKY